MYKEITAALWKACGKRIRDRWIELLRAGKTVTAGDVTIHAKGIKITVRKLFGSKEVMIPWKALGINRKDGDINIWNKANPKEKVSMSQMKVLNAPIVYEFVRWLFAKGRNGNIHK